MPPIHSTNELKWHQSADFWATALFSRREGVRASWSSWLRPLMGQAQRGVCNLLLWHRLLGISLLLGAALTECLFISVDNRLWGRFPISCGRCDRILLIFCRDQTLRCLRPRKHMVPTTTLGGWAPTLLMSSGLQSVQYMSLVPIPPFSLPFHCRAIREFFQQ